MHFCTDFHSSASEIYDGKHTITIEYIDREDAASSGSFHTEGYVCFHSSQCVTASEPDL